MNGPHDLGGAMGFGAVSPEVDEPTFHHPWERRAFALTLAMGAIGKWNLDMSRAARERIVPAVYLSNSYYQTWLDALESLMLEGGLVDASEIATGQADASAASVTPLAAGRVEEAIRRGSPTRRPATQPARFALGDRVRTILAHPSGHTRMPRYARGRHGRVIAAHGMHVFPDAHAAGLGESPRWLYTVAFDARELWGADSSAAAIHVDCWEPYLEATDDRTG